MKVAIPVFRSRISPVFDVAHLCLLVRLRNGAEAERTEVALKGRLPMERVALLRDEGVNVLICGAITGPTRFLVETAGMRILAGVAGDVDKVLRAFRERALDQPCFRMPGCRRQRWKGGRGRRGR
jgi:predicted Fe-Mo cluster-binding NifX family protein